MVDLGGYIIILTNDDGKIKLYGSAADNMDTLKVSDEILEVNGRTLENATHNEVIQYIHQCIQSRTICLRLRRSGNKMEELDGPKAGRIRDAWIIAVERSARERLQKYTALKKIQPRDIQAILHQRINDAVASTSEDSTSKDVSNGQITVTLADKELGTNAFSTKLSNGTIPKGLGKEADIRVEDTSQERKDALEKQQSCEEANLLLPVQSGRIGERRSSSPFQNGRTEVLIGEPEGGPRSPRGSTSSAVNDGNFLNPLDERDEPICRSRRRSGSGVTDIHSQQQQQQLQLQENNNSSSRDAKKPQEGLGPDEMWAPGALGHHRELPVDVPDTLLQKAYPNKVKNCSSNYRNELQHRPRSASDLDLSLNLKNGKTLKTRIIADGRARRARLESNDRAHDVTDATARTINVHNGLQPSMLKIELNIEDEEEKVKATRKNLGLDNYRDSPIATGSPDLKSTFKAFEVYANVDEDAGGQKESSVDIEDDYPFAKEDYPTMLKTCSDDSASPRSSSGRSDSTAPLDTSLMLRHSKNHKDSPTYDVRRIDLGSPCRSMMPDIKVAPLFSRTRDTTSFDNPAYGLTDLQDLQGLLRSDEMSDLTRLIDEQSPIPRTPQDQDNVSPVRVKDQQTELSQTETASKSGKSPTKRRTNDERAKLKAKTRSLDIEELIRAGSTDDLLGIELSNLSSSSSSSRQRPKKKRHQQISSGYSTLRSEASGDLEHNAERSFLVVGRKPYREVAVDCPPDFVPVTKCHPIYPPPNKTPGNSKHNTLEPKRDRPGVANEESSCATTTTTMTMTTTTTTLVASPRLSPNDNSFTTLSSADGSAKETVVARTVDRKHSLKKVRSRVKSLICDSLQSILHHEHGISLNAYRTLNAPTYSHSGDPVLRSFVMKTENFNEFSRTRNSFDERDGKLFRDRGVENPCFEDDSSRRSFLESRERPLSSVLGEEFPKNCQNSFLGEAETNNMTSSPFPKATGDSMCLNRRSLSGFQDKVVSSCQEKLLDFGNETEEVIFPDCSNEINLLPKEGIAFFKVADHPANIPDQLSFIQETNQNSRNFLREFSSIRKRVGRLSNNTRFSDNFRPQEKERDSPDCLDDSPKTQNEKNSRLSFEYECSKLLDVPSMLSNNGVKFRVSWRSASDLSNLTVGCHSVIKKRSSSFPNFVSMPEITFSRPTNGGDKVDHPVVLHDGLPDERTKQSAPKSPMYTLKNCSLKSHVDALEQQVNYNGLRLSLETFARRIIRTASLHFGNLHALQSNFAFDCLLNYLIKFIILVVFLDAKGRDLSI